MISIHPATKTGYEFLYWADSTGQPVYDIDPNTATTDYNLTAKWELIEFYVTFYDQYSYPVEGFEHKKITYGSNVTAPSSFSSTFSGGVYTVPEKWVDSTNGVSVNAGQSIGTLTTSMGAEFTFIISGYTTP